MEEEEPFQVNHRAVGKRSRCQGESFVGEKLTGWAGLDRVFY